MSEVDNIISQFLNDAPPGELKEVIRDLKLILGSDIVKSIKANLETSIVEGDKIQAIPVSKEKLSIISKHNTKGPKFYDSTLKKVFNVQYLEIKAIDIEEDEEEEEDNDKDNETLLKLIDSLGNYSKEHFPLNNSQKSSAFDVFQTSEDEYILVLINTKNNSSNFINGNWVSYYKYNSSSESLTGRVSVDIHYYEDGNVRLRSSKDIEESKISVDKVIITIKGKEEEYETQLNKKFSKLNEVDFKSLRRPLPVTRAKINWGSAIGNYRLGKDVTEA